MNNLPYDVDSKNQFIETLANMTPQEIAAFFDNSPKDKLLQAINDLTGAIRASDEAKKGLAETVTLYKNEVAEVGKKLETVQDELQRVKQELDNVKKDIANIKEEQQEMKVHLKDLYYSHTIEETLDSMARLGVFTMEAESCKAYNFDPIENKLFTVDSDLERQYIDLDGNSSYIAQAVATKTPVVNNEYFNENIGDNEAISNVKNVAVIPIVSKKDEVIGVVVAKNKADGFNDKDSKHFDAREGTIGSTVCTTLENKALEQISNTDALTHLNNRSGAVNYLKYNVLPKAKENKPFATIMIDIDHFKNFNDTFGHDVGDMVLKQVADVLKSSVRDMDGVFRWGGEEMVVIADGLNAVEGYALAERLRKRIEETPLDIGNGNTVQITTSMGVAEINPFDYARTSKADVLHQFENVTLKRADNYLYEAKHNGRNRVYAAQEVMEQAKASLESEKPVVAVKSFDCKQDIDNLHYKDCLLLDTGTDVAAMRLTAADKSGKDMDIDLKLHVAGETAIRFKDEWYEKVDEFPAELRKSIECGDYSSFDIISSNYYACKCTATIDGKAIADNEIIWNKKTLDTPTPDDLRQALISHAEGFVEAIENGKELTERCRNQHTAAHEKTAEIEGKTADNENQKKNKNKHELEM